MKKFINKLKRKKSEDKPIFKQGENYVTRTDRLKLSHTGRHLIVDDSEVIREVLKYILQQKNIEVYEATNGAEAVDVIRDNNPDYFDVIWIDNKMPLMSGIKAANILRTIGYNNIMIMITGSITPDTLTNCKDKGVDMICLKPLVPEKIYKMKIFSIYDTDSL